MERTHTPKLSVIMGVYNCKEKKLLLESVKSVISQTFLDWELLICNDGSVDDTANFLDEISKLDSRVRILSYDKNCGLNHALNTCLKEARGKYIARQDDDDRSYPQRFETQIQFMEEHPEYSVIGTNADVYDDNGIWGSYKVDEKPTKESFLWNSPFIHPTVMMRKSTLEIVKGYREVKAARRCEDYDLFMRLYAKGYKGYNIQENLYCYRMVNDLRVKHRPMKYRIDEAIIRYQGFRQSQLMPKGIIYVVKPILIGLIPQRILYEIKKKRY